MKTFFQCIGCNKPKPIKEKHRVLMKYILLHEKSKKGHDEEGVYTDTHYVWVCNKCYEGE